MQGGREQGQERDSSSSSSSSSGWKIGIDPWQVVYSVLAFGVVGGIASAAQQTFFEKIVHTKRFRERYGTLIPCLSEDHHEAIAQSLIDLVFCMVYEERLSERETEKKRLGTPFLLKPNSPEDDLWRSLCGNIGTILGYQFRVLNKSRNTTAQQDQSLVTPKEESMLLDIWDDIQDQLEDLGQYCLYDLSEIWTVAKENLETEIPLILSTILGRKI